MQNYRKFARVGRIMAAAAFAVAIPGTSAAQAVLEAGSVLRLNEPVVFEPRQTRVRMQHGRTVPRVNQNEPHCILNRTAPSTDEQNMLPDDLKVTNRRRTSRAQIRPTAYYTTELSLESEVNPNLGSLTCTVLREPSQSHLTTAEIREVVGDLLTLP